MQTDTILHGDIRQIARTLPDGSVHCIVTSPPYYGLRDYGTAEWEGGREDCDHVERNARNDTGAERLAERAMIYGTGQGSGSKVETIKYRDICPKCGAIRKDAQIGMEASPQEYVETLVGIFRELKRVLRDDGSLWLNLGDSYAGSGKGRNADGTHQEGGKQGTNRGTIEGELFKTDTSDLKPKDLIGIPWRVALALQADGWYLRADIIWSKPNPMPESVSDRPTKAHEYIFLLSKSERYYYDQEAVREPLSQSFIDRWQSASPVRKNPSPQGLNVSGVKGESCFGGSENGRNRRTVWTVATQPYKPAHFATFPPDLIRPAILAGCPERVCSECGAPWVRVVEKELINQGVIGNGKRQPEGHSHDRVARGELTRAGDSISQTIGFRPTCNHYDHLYLQDFPKSRKARKRYQRDTSGDWWRRVRRRPGLDSWPSEPGVVFDPFLGSGTVGQVAIELDPSRCWLGCELSQDYIDLAWDRINAAKMEKVAGRDYAKQMAKEKNGYQQLGLIGA